MSNVPSRKLLYIPWKYFLNFKLVKGAYGLKVGYFDKHLFVQLFNVMNKLHGSLCIFFIKLS